VTPCRACGVPSQRGRSYCRYHWRRVQAGLDVTDDVTQSDARKAKAPPAIRRTREQAIADGVSTAGLGKCDGCGDAATVLMRKKRVAQHLCLTCYRMQPRPA